MKNMIEILQKSSLRLTLCAMVFGCTSQAVAQDETVSEQPVVAAAKKSESVVKENFTLMTIRGTVLDLATKEPLAGIQLQAMGHHRYTAMTDEKGNFEIKMPDFITSLYVHSPSYLSQQVAVAEGEEVQIMMLSDKFDAMYTDDTDYTAKGSFNVSSSAPTVEAEIGNMIGADIRTINRSAAPGNGSVMFVRGLNSLNASAQPLVVIDGVEMDMQLSRASLHDGQFNNILANISPDDIEKVTVLKNATALYGARGANGVILIETKRGHSMATRIDANISAGVSLVPELPTMMDARQYRAYATEMLGTIKENTLLTGANKIDYHFLNDDPNGYYYHMYHNNTDWTDEVYEEAITQNYSINVQGGDAVGMYNLSVGYMDAESTARNNGFDRMNVRFNTDISIIDNLSTKFDISISRTNTEVFDDGVPADLTAGPIVSPTFLSLIKSPLLSPYQYNAVIGGYSELLSTYDDLFAQLGPEYSLANPVGVLKSASGDNKNKAENTLFNIHLTPTLNIGKDFKLTESISYSLHRNSQRYHRPTDEYVPSFNVDGVGTVMAKVMSFFAKETNLVSDTRLDWSHQYGKHGLSAFAGFRYNYFSYDCSDLTTEYQSTTNDKNPSLSHEELYKVLGDNDVWKNMQWYGNVDYNYMNRYFVTLSLLGEANSRFGENVDGLSMFGVQWALFPSVQLGWVMTNEKWFPKNAGINYLRLNAGFDMSGNDNISNYAALTSFTAVKYTNHLAGLQLTNIGNDKIKWETTTKWNVGFESYMLDNRLGISFDYYIHKTKDLLTLKSFSNPIAGINRYWTNGGELQNTGFEAKVNVKPIVTKDWRLEIGATIGHYKNEITALPDGNFTTSVYGEDNILTAVGGPVGQFYGYQTAGVLSTDAEAKAAGKDGKDYLYMKDAAGVLQKFGAGDVHFVDRTGDGIIDANDKTVIGDPNPDIYGNIHAKLNWKNLTLSLGFNYSLGNDVYNYQRSILNSGSTLYNQQVAETGHWRYEGQQTTLPKLAYGDPMGNNRFSDRWIEDGSYLRLKTVKLYYQIPIPEVWTSWLQGLAVWAEAQNLVTFTKYLGTDPEVTAGNGVLYQGIDCGNLALGRNFTLGVKINL